MNCERERDREREIQRERERHRERKRENERERGRASERASEREIEKEREIERERDRKKERACNHVEDSTSFFAPTEAHAKGHFARKKVPLARGPYSRTMPGALRWTEGGVAPSCKRGTPAQI